MTELGLGAFLPVDGATPSILGELERLSSDDAERGFSFRMLASLVAAAEATFANGRTCCELEIENCGPLSYSERWRSEQKAVKTKAQGVSNSSTPRSERPLCQ